ncbi:nuclear transport factor 2 domain-containing protein [Cryptosporidium muris RN66]|uniref:Nuclear transport factor 2 n=1 Tax=Cryptosporidium muris (strain RN66) TaxID=441375 RepID=B6AEI1_CRYMR|nr:nuclear transport factor 2 domain-containing protein [Cryptosporidium muris RN66]EEA06598.1 nuclear transport factor 2 domain-containing protein [Cryptosporidium muris RN66]|eukprot:XP_002140947.1 nuclear transport factor 2 domain-containing protein [Cryptosporidium muris RN66]
MTQSVSLNPQFDQIGRQFVQHYYQTFQNNRSGLGVLYGPQSMLTWEDSQFQGQANISAKLGSLNFQRVKFDIVRADCQPSPENGVIVFVTGDVSIDEGQPLKFSQVFNLLPSGNCGYIIFNDLFRLNLG